VVFQTSNQNDVEHPAQAHKRFLDTLDFWLANIENGHWWGMDTYSQTIYNKDCTWQSVKQRASVSKTVSSFKHTKTTSSVFAVSFQGIRRERFALLFLRWFKLAHNLNMLTDACFGHTLSVSKKQSILSLYSGNTPQLTRSRRFLGGVGFLRTLGVG